MLIPFGECISSTSEEKFNNISKTRCNAMEQVLDEKTGYVSYLMYMHRWQHRSVAYAPPHLDCDATCNDAYSSCDSVLSATNSRSAAC